MKRITVDEQSLRVIEGALELLMRFGMGQWEYFEEVLRTEDFGSEDNWIRQYDIPLVEKKLFQLKEEIFGMPPNGSLSVRNESIPDTFRVAADMFLKVRASRSPQQCSESPPIGDRRIHFYVEDVNDL